MENQLVERKFKGSIELKEGLTLEVNSLDEFYSYLPEKAECRDSRNTTELFLGNIHFIQQSGVFRAICISYILDYSNHYGDIYELYTEVYTHDINTDERIRYPLDKGEVLISDIKDLLPGNVKPKVIKELISYLIESSNDYDTDNFKLTLINNIDSLINPPYSWIDESEEIIIDSYCEEIINRHKDYLLANFPSIIEAYKLYQVYEKQLYLKVRLETLEALWFIYKSFKTIKEKNPRSPFTPKIKDNRLEFLPNGPYYHEDSRLIWECNITSIYSAIETENGDITLNTAIDYEDDEQKYTWYGSTNNLPPLVESNIYLLFKADRTREEILQAYRYPYSTKLEAPSEYPFKYIYPNESISA
jgi:hypothetical protein